MVRRRRRRRRELVVLLSAVVRDDGSNTERDEERKGDIYTTRDANRLHSERWIQSNSIWIFFFFSFSPFYLLLNQRRTFFDSSVWNEKGGEKEEKEEEEGEGDGSSTKKKDKTSLHVYLSRGVVGLKLFWSLGVLGQNFIKEEEEEKREKKFTKVI